MKAARRYEPGHWWADHRRAGFTRPSSRNRSFKWRRLADGWGWIDSIGPYVFTLLADDEGFWRAQLKVGDTLIHSVHCSTRAEASHVAKGFLVQIERLDSSYTRLTDAIREMREALDLDDGRYE